MLPCRVRAFFSAFFRSVPPTSRLEFHSSGHNFTSSACRDVCFFSVGPGWARWVIHVEIRVIIPGNFSPRNSQNTAPRSCLTLVWLDELVEFFKPTQTNPGTSNRTIPRCVRGRKLLLLLLLLLYCYLLYYCYSYCCCSLPCGECPCNGVTFRMSIAQDRPIHHAGIPKLSRICRTAFLPLPGNGFCCTWKELIQDCVAFTVPLYIIHVQLRTKTFTGARAC